jgi:hypothetical protein
MEDRNHRTESSRSKASAYPKGPFSIELTSAGDIVTITDATGARRIYVYVSEEFALTCPPGTHMVWTGGGLRCVPD